MNAWINRLPAGAGFCQSIAGQILFFFCKDQLGDGCYMQIAMTLVRLSSNFSTKQKVSPESHQRNVRSGNGRRLGFQGFFMRVPSFSGKGAGARHLAINAEVDGRDPMRMGLQVIRAVYSVLTRVRESATHGFAGPSLSGAEGFDPRPFCCFKVFFEKVKD